ncbi:MAG: hypothetical protein ACLFR7_03720 [Opitutales bacterium]
MAYIYVILGGPPSELAAFASYLLRHGMEDATQVPVILETPVEAAFRAVWEQTQTEAPLTATEDLARAMPALSPALESAFFVPTPERDPRPFLETLRSWMEEQGHTLARIYTVADCAALAASQSGPYFDLCLHFTDVYFLGHREEVSKKWIQQYRDQLRKRALPAQVELLRKGGKVDDVHALLFPEARRLTQFFDPPDESILPGLEIEGMAENEGDDTDPRDPQNDPYLERNEEGAYRHPLRAR